MGKLIMMFKYIMAQFINIFIQPDKNYWVFSSSFNSRFNYNSKYLFEYVLKEHPEIKCRFVLNDKQRREDLKKKYGDVFIDTGTIRGIIEALKAGIWFTSAGLPVYLFTMGRKRKIINLWHGVPLKRIGLKEKGLNKFKEIYFKQIFSKNYSVICTTSSKLTGVMSESFGVDQSKVKVLGQPRNDLLNRQIEKTQWLYEKYGELPDYEKAILYAPTFREFGETSLFPFEDFKAKDLNKFLEEEKAIIFIRFHQSEGNMKFREEYGINRILFINEDIVEDIMEVLNIFDLLITDYSSIFIDYLLLQRPEIFIPYDLETYSQKRGFNFNYNTHTPGPKVYFFKDFKDQLKYSLHDVSYYRKERIQLNDFFNEVKVNSCKNITDYIREVTLTGGRHVK